MRCSIASSVVTARQLFTHKISSKPYQKRWWPVRLVVTGEETRLRCDDVPATTPLDAELWELTRILSNWLHRAAQPDAYPCYRYTRSASNWLTERRRLRATVWVTDSSLSSPARRRYAAVERRPPVSVGHTGTETIRAPSIMICALVYVPI